MTKAEIQAMYEVMFTDYPDIVNIAQVQSMLGISRHLAYELIGDGYIPGMKIGNAYRVPKINVIRYALSAGNPQPVQVTVTPQAQPDAAATSADTPEQQV